MKRLIALAIIAPILGVVVRRRHRSHVYSEFNWDSRNRTRLRWSLDDVWFVVLERGNGNSDPLWAIGIEGRRS